MTTLFVRTHRDAEVVADDVVRLLDTASALGIEIYADPGEADKHPVLAEATARTEALGMPLAALRADAILIMGGDGTLLRTLTEFRQGPPIFGVNYGQMGYLAAADPDDIGDLLESIAQGQVRSVNLTAIQATFSESDLVVTAINDIVVGGGYTGSIAELSWEVGVPVSPMNPDEREFTNMGESACDGLCVSTAVGSTAFNLSLGGPILSWGVDGAIVMLIAPHQLNNRPLVVARNHTIKVTHLERGADLPIVADGAEVGVLKPGETVDISLAAASPRLGLYDNRSYYDRFLQHFGGPSSVPRPARPRKAHS